MWILPSAKSRMRGSESNRAQAGARRNSSGSLAMLAAMRGEASVVSRWSPSVRSAICREIRGKAEVRD
jgi:hypothetical protein